MTNQNTKAQKGTAKKQKQSSVAKPSIARRVVTNKRKSSSVAKSHILQPKPSSVPKTSIAKRGIATKKRPSSAAKTPIPKPKPSSIAKPTIAETSSVESIPIPTVPFSFINKVEDTKRNYEKSDKLTTLVKERGRTYRDKHRDSGKLKWTSFTNKEWSIKKDTPTGPFKSIFFYDVSTFENKKDFMKERNQNTAFARGNTKSFFLEPCQHVGAKGSFIIPWLPSVTLVKLLTFFKTDDFHAMAGIGMFDIEKNLYNGPEDEISASYQMYSFDDTKNKTTKLIPDLWKKPHKLLTCAHVVFLDEFSTALVQSLENALGDENDGKTKFIFHPGVVKTHVPKHQFLHLDEKDNQDSFVLHLPLCKEGMHLRIAWDENSQFKQDFLHIPFGSALLLKSTVWHAGHYGSENNIRFHAVIQRGDWNAKELKILKKTHKKCKQLEEEIMKKVQDPKQVTKLYKTRVDGVMTKNAIRAMRRAHAGEIWLSLLEDKVIDKNE